MKADDVNSLLQQHFGQKSGFDPNAAKQLASTIATASSAIAHQTGSGPAASSPTPKQQACYASCEATRDAALTAAAAKGWPLGGIAAAAAVFAFNACRHNCDSAS